MSGTHYLISDSCRGPWRLAPGPTLDCAVFPKRYACRMLSHDGRMHLLGFRWFDKEGGRFVGAISDPDLIEVSSDGLLRVAHINNLE